MGLGDKFKNIVDKTVDKIDDNITRAGEDDSEHIARYCKDSASETPSKRRPSPS